MEANFVFSLFKLLLNDKNLFECIHRITNCGPIGYFNPRVYRFNPEAKHFDSWNSAMNGHRLIAMSINLSQQSYQGGVLQIRDANSGQMIAEMPNIVPGDAIVFRLSDDLDHQVTSVEGQFPTIACAGWFEKNLNSLKLLKREKMQSL